MNPNLHQISTQEEHKIEINSPLSHEEDMKKLFPQVNRDIEFENYEDYEEHLQILEIIEKNKDLDAKTKINVSNRADGSDFTHKQAIPREVRYKDDEENIIIHDDDF